MARTNILITATSVFEVTGVEVHRDGDVTAENYRLLDVSPESVRISPRLIDWMNQRGRWKADTYTLHHVHN